MPSRKPIAVVTDDCLLPLFEYRCVEELVLRIRAENAEEAMRICTKWNLWLGGPNPKDEMKPGDPDKVFECYGWSPVDISIGEVV